MQSFAQTVIPGYTLEMKTAISVPDDIFRQVEEQAHELQMNRSEFFTAAVKRFLNELEEESITTALNAAVKRGGPEHSIVDSGLARIAELTEGDEW
jgi:predicted transcriptional regulator